MAFHATGPGYGGGWTCPAETVTLVKSLYIYNRGTASANIEFLALTHLATAQFIILHEAIATTTSFAWEGWLVLNPGDSVNVSTDAADVSFWLSGAVLLGPPPYPNVPSLLPTVEPYR
jgi:hypothetical protein